MKEIKKMMSGEKRPDIEILYDLADLYRVFGDSTRVRIIEELLFKNMNVSEISERLSMSQSAISHQLRILRDSGLVRTERSGKEVLYMLADEHVRIIFYMGLEHILEKRGG
ncbi:MAG: ArsR/SmtB family transcription factor [Candidatus Fimenecus sp.]